ncbi:MAG TPA: ABC transporter substrate-binding protein, partial [Verrucomicrobiae bacterium]|nr:ABC transporter substrate-binding protein [Verrucomicrobiae bacterium]
YVAAGAGDTFIAAMKQGKIDIGITTQPTVLRMLSSGDAKMHVDLFTPTGAQASLGGNYPFISLFAKTDYINANKGVVQRVVNAYVKTLKWIQTHTPTEIAEKLPADYYGGDKAAYIQALTDSMKMFSPDGKMQSGAPEFVLSVLKQFNDAVQKAPSIDLSKTYTNDFVANAK